jgi:hypothetical protein
LNPHRPARTPRTATHAAWLVVAASLGFALSSASGQAHALGLPTITLPGLTTVPLPTLPTTTATTTTAAAAATTTGAQTAPAPAPTPAPTATTATTAVVPDAPAADTALAGAIRLAGGVVSIPVSSVRAPARLRILLSVAPTQVTRASQPVSVRTRIVDTRGYVVRGARVVVRAGRSGTLRGAGTRVSTADGLAGFVVRNRVAIRRGAKLLLVVQAVDPRAPKAATASRRLQIAMRRR